MFQMARMSSVDDLARASMIDISANNPDCGSVRSRAQPNLVALLCLHTIMCCISLIFVPQQITYQKTAALFDNAHVIRAVINAASFAPVAIFFHSRPI